MIRWPPKTSNQKRNDETSNIDSLMAEAEAIFANPDAYLAESGVSAETQAYALVWAKKYLRKFLFIP